MSFSLEAMRYAQLVLGPAGSGKSRYCSTMQKHAANSGRRIDVVNLDPAAEQVGNTIEFVLA